MSTIFLYDNLIKSDLLFADKLAIAVKRGWINFPEMVISSWEKMNKLENDN